MKVTRGSKSDYSLSASIRHVLLESKVVLLDLNAQGYYILNSEASAIWSILIDSQEPVNQVEALVSQFDLSPQQATTEIEGFKQQCIQRGWLLASGKANIKSKRRYSIRRYPVSRLLAWSQIVRTHLAISRHRFSTVYDSCLHLAEYSSGNLHDGKRLRQGLNSFRFAENWWISRRGEDDCLPRSLSLFRYLTMIGCKVHHCIGIELMPFRAHAWVEADDLPLLNSQDLIDDYKVIARI